MSNKEDEARSHKLMYKAFELNLSKPSQRQLASAILYDNDCNDLQSNNNLSFLQKVEKALSEYVYGIELNFKDSDELAILDCDCDYDCECSLNNFLMPIFKNIARNFDLDIDANNSLINDVLEAYTLEERHRLLDCNISELTRIVMYKSLAYLSYDLGFYDISCRHHEVAVLIYGGATAQTNFDPSKYIENELSYRAKKANEARWQGHVEQQRRKYLELDKQRQSDLGKKLTIKSVATWIYEHHNQNNLEYETIRDHLSKARKGEFTND